MIRRYMLGWRGQLYHIAYWLADITTAGRCGGMHDIRQSCWTLRSVSMHCLYPNCAVEQNSDFKRCFADIHIGPPSFYASPSPGPAKWRLSGLMHQYPAYADGVRALTNGGAVTEVCSVDSREGGSTDKDRLG